MSGIRFLFRTSIVVLWALSLVACHKQESTDGTEASIEEAVPYYNTPDFTPIWLSDPDEVETKITHRTGDFSFRDQTNALVTQQTLANKIHVANFFFTACPTICPKMTNLLKAVQDTFQHEPRVALLSFSVTPWLDSVPRLRKYAAEKGVIATKWHLLTGDRGKLYTLARRSYFAEEAIGFTKDSTEFLHTEHIILVDRNRRIRGVYNGTLPLDIDKLITDIKLLLREI
ncbi:SCO family protein [Spirosoma linguale]|uniref:Electron transport protein SCO1/SenC n=1 Tax=Spirosoma linguale (strain ATCC 33905 / DSM 74 / LMG 10896 / Claus 1) TaxID=504472 RepID=D2QGU6_SPILD|nr:electron transport protein SCO1/SenC [Spirosoma linguale DSM 74]